MSAANSANQKTAPGDLAGALGALTGVVMMISLAAWLIATGLPKWIGNKDFTKARRRAWYKLAGLGLVVMIVLSIGLAAISQFVAATLVMWAYWFGWTWIAWRIADNKTKRLFESPSAAGPEPAATATAGSSS